MRNRNPRRGDRWDDRDRPGDFYDRERGLSPEEGPYRPDEEYFGQREQYGRGLDPGSSPDYRATSWRTARFYGDRDYERENRSRYGRYGRSSTYDRPEDRYPRHAEPWAGRSNFETGFTGWGTNKYERNQYDPYWTSDEDDRQNDRSRRHWWDRAADEVASWFGDDAAEQRRQMDQRRHGDFRGKGPKGYTRSDDRIKDDINDRLTDDYALDASDIDVDVNNCDVVLTGTVESRYEKRRAEDVAEFVSGVRNVENRIRVRDNFGSTWHSSTTGYSDANKSDSDYYNGETNDRSRGASSGTT